MNPYTQYLMEQLEDAVLAKFVRAWDELEALIIQTYRAGQIDQETRRRLAVLQAALATHYKTLRSQLEPFWRSTKIGGRPVELDPFDAILSFATREQLIDNWTAMQTLPAARESLNQYILSRIEVPPESR